MKKELENILLHHEEFLVEGMLNKNKLSELARKHDAKLLNVLMREEKIKNHFFSELEEGILVFKKDVFLQFLNNKEYVLKSKISNIDNNATKTEKGNFFKVEAEISLTDVQAKKIRYGIEGRAVVITGSKTYFDYYLDQFLRKD